MKLILNDVERSLLYGVLSEYLKDKKENFGNNILCRIKDELREVN